MVTKWLSTILNLFPNSFKSNSLGILPSFCQRTFNRGVIKVHGVTNNLHHILPNLSGFFCPLAQIRIKRGFFCFGPAGSDRLKKIVQNIGQLFFAFYATQPSRFTFSSSPPEHLRRAEGAMIEVNRAPLRMARVVPMQFLRVSEHLADQLANGLGAIF